MTDHLLFFHCVFMIHPHPSGKQFIRGFSPTACYSWSFECSMVKMIFFWPSFYIFSDTLASLLDGHPGNLSTRPFSSFNGAFKRHRRLCIYIHNLYIPIYIYIFINFFIVESKSLNASPGHFCGHLHCYSQRPWPLHSCVHCTYFVIIAHAYSSVSQPWNYLYFQPDNFFL